MTESTRAEFEAWWNSSYGQTGDDKEYAFEAWQAATAKRGQPTPSRQEIEDAKDAARYRYVVENSFDSDTHSQFHVWLHPWEPHSKTREPTEWKQRLRGPGLTRFIDAALKKGSES